MQTTVIINRGLKRPDFAMYKYLQNLVYNAYMRLLIAFELRIFNRDFYQE